MLLSSGLLHSFLSFARRLHQKAKTIMEVGFTDIQRIVLAVFDHAAYHYECFRRKLRSLVKAE